MIIDYTAEEILRIFNFVSAIVHYAMDLRTPDPEHLKEIFDIKLDLSTTNRNRLRDYIYRMKGKYPDINRLFMIDSKEKQKIVVYADGINQITDQSIYDESIKRNDWLCKTVPIYNEECEYLLISIPCLTHEYGVGNKEFYYSIWRLFTVILSETSCTSLYDSVHVLPDEFRNIVYWFSDLFTYTLIDGKYDFGYAGENYVWFQFLRKERFLTDVFGFYTFITEDPFGKSQAKVIVDNIISSMPPKDIWGWATSSFGYMIYKEMLDRYYKDHSISKPLRHL